jgi:hypothetical protein
MQQAGQATSSISPSTGGNSVPPAIGEPGFVINLCASTTPMALPRHEHPELKRFAFFISRRREDGRERFRLHMGYFPSQEQAEQLLELVREIYPAAWAGVAPGQRLRAAAAASLAAAPAALEARPAVTAPVPAAPGLSRPSVAPPTERAPIGAPRAAAGSAAAPAVVAAAPVPSAAARPVAQPPPAVTQPPAAAASALAPAKQSLQSVRAAISVLEPARPGPAPAPVPPTVVMPELRAVPVARPVVVPASVARTAAATAVGHALSASQVLRVLEAPSAVPGQRSETAAYAVQLLWSVQPIDMGSVPQLAIFSAYTLYGAAGNRDGRRWYGLRLGFFTDAVSAKQVANYVRSEFTSVSIVPVSARERERALAAAPRASLPESGTAPKKTAINIASSGEFRLLDEQPAANLPAANGTARAARAAPGKRAKLRTPPAGQEGAAAPKRRAPLSLEETLEILGASELKLQDGRDNPVSDSGVRHLRLEAIKGRRASRFTRLMDRLSERFSGS